ncbi:STAS domain-containing protein [Shewanella insulae]|uniref:STAS domain-containing protein n=1 Tax=Shewanella insulae TaxID=2681496 RepID=A0A6L7HTZ1_9GAMM|nr:STAS domain-containing protein [Shewanella insulae]MCG9712467.1 STAS domain-containing protein [Shewanella insulae]MCG9738396.1 STAS domain-containing protein [Shewanella insulae]MCG9754258.1 STAS domain-containing protein [Shewanella insulae]MXR67772.1 STAS domain-containing protein [Shewanella insulae]
MLAFNQEAGHCQVNGELSQAAVVELWPRLETLLNGACERLDLSGVSYSDSAGVALLLHLVAERQAKSKPLMLCNPPQQLKKLIDLYDLQDFFIEEAK